MTKLVIADINADYGATGSINTAFDDIVIAVENTLSRDGTSPNAMSAILDMGSNKINNLAEPVDPNDAARKIDLDAVIAAGLPDQTAHANKFIQTDGSVVSWEVPAATEVSNTPAGDIAATTVQAAIDELDTEKQPLDATLTSISLLGTAVDRLGYTTGVDTWAETPITSAGRSILDDASISDIRTTLDVYSTTETDAIAATLFKGDAGGTVDVITTTLSPPYSTLVDDTIVFLQSVGANTSTTPTLNVSGLGAKTIVKEGNQPLSVGDIPRIDYECILKYNSSNTVWELLNPAIPASSSGASLVLLATGTASASTSLDFTGLDTTYSSYQFTFDSILPASNNVSLRMRVSTDNGSTFITTSSYEYTNLATIRLVEILIRLMPL